MKSLGCKNMQISDDINWQLHKKRQFEWWPSFCGVWEKNSSLDESDRIDEYLIELHSIALYNKFIESFKFWYRTKIIGVNKSHQLLFSQQRVLSLLPEKMKYIRTKQCRTYRVERTNAPILHMQYSTFVWKTVKLKPVKWKAKMKIAG